MDKLTATNCYRANLTARVFPETSCVSASTLTWEKSMNLTTEPKPLRRSEGESFSAEAAMANRLRDFFGLQPEWMKGLVFSLLRSWAEHGHGVSETLLNSDAGASRSRSSV